VGSHGNHTPPGPRYATHSTRHGPPGRVSLLFIARVIVLGGVPRSAITRARGLRALREYCNRTLPSKRALSSHLYYLTFYRPVFNSFHQAASGAAVCMVRAASTHRYKSLLSQGVELP
jgi:hypothetical protein